MSQKVFFSLLHIMRWASKTIQNPFQKWILWRTLNSWIIIQAHLNEQKSKFKFSYPEMGQWKQLMAYLGPVQCDPLWRAGLVVAGLPLDGPVGETVAVLHCLLLGRLDPPDAQHGPGPHAPVTRLPTLRPVPDEPPVRTRREGERQGR